VTSPFRKPMVCATPGPDCSGPVRQYMNHRSCEHHAPPPPPIPDPSWGAAWGVKEREAEHRLALAQAAKIRNQGMAKVRQADEAARDQAITQVDHAAADGWKDQARRAIWHLAQTRNTFTVDDVWDLLEARQVASPQEPRALGPVLMRAVRAHAIEDTGQMAKSRRRHGTKITIYRKAPR
jgi:hypothetical protein